LINSSFRAALLFSRNGAVIFMYVFFFMFIYHRLFKKYCIATT
jgi:hypothetical protein